MALRPTAISLAAFAAIPAAALAATSFPQYTAPHEEIPMLIEDRGVRSLGMGGTGVSSQSPTATGFYNPASLAWSGANFQWGRENRSYDVSYSDYRLTASTGLGGADAWHGWRVGAGVAYSDQSLPANAPMLLSVTGTRDWFVSMLAAVAWGGDHVCASVGGTAKYVHNSYYADDRFWTFDVGGIVGFPLMAGDARIRPRMGVAVSNLGGQIGVPVVLGEEVIDVAHRTRYGVGLDIAGRPVSVLGGAWRREVSPFSASIDVDDSHPDDGSSDVLSWGFELSSYEAFHLRFGTRHVPGDTGTMGLGVGWQFGRLAAQIDYANVATDYKFFDDSSDHVFGVMVGGRFQ